MRLLIKLIAFITLVFSTLMIFEHYEMLSDKKEIGLKRIDPIPETMHLIEEEKYAQAAEYLDFFMQFDYVINNEKAQKLHEALEQKRNSMAYQSQKAVEGVFQGKSDETIGQVSAGISDFFLFGDLRDLTIEGYHYIKGEEVDNVLVGLSSIGVVASGATLFSGGTSASVKGGITTLKFIKKSGKMPLWMEKLIIRSSKQIKDLKDLKPMEKLFSDIYTVTKSSGVNTTIKLLNASPSLKAFRNSIGFAKMFGKESGALLKVLGDDAPLYYRMLKDKTSKKAFLTASTYGVPGIKTLAKVGEKRFLKSLKPAVKTSRLAKVFNKHIVDYFHKIPVGIYMLMAAVSLVFLI